MKYYFDFYITANVKNHELGFNGKVTTLSNSKDSTYTFRLSSSDTKKEGNIYDRKKRISIKFDTNFDFKKIEDLNKLSNSKLYTVVEYVYPEKYPNYVEDFEFENDTLNTTTIVHLTRFKNKKRKKIINEHYYYFGLNDNLNETSKNSIKFYFIKKYNLNTIINKNLLKSIYIKNGAIASESEFTASKNVDFNFEFEIDDVYPKH